MSEQQVWIGIDTGGTFTDVVLFDRGRERFHYLKLATSTEAPWRAIVDGVDQLLDELRLPPAAVRRLAHGTTLGTNALLEGRLPRTGMITTAGFRDVLELARQRRPHMFNLHVQKPDTIAAREDRLEVRERLDETGGVLEPLDHEQLLACAIRLREQGCTALAVCFLHSYANPAHERRARELIESNWPEVYVSVSHEVLAEMHEYERFCTTVVNAALRPIMDGYLSKLEQQLANLGLNVVPGIMQSNGGTVTPASVRRLPVNTCVSGPAAGVVAAQRLGQRMAAPDLLTFDMGGTSTDVCLVSAGEPAMQNERSIAGLPVRTRGMDIHTVGAGGGSLAWIDPAGLLKVGPASAGAHPGPAAYLRGGQAPTVTDANFVLGRLAEGELLGGRMTCSLDAARRAVQGLATRLGLGLEETAAGIIQIVNTNMVGALRTVSVERGHDPRDFALLAYGGAGPLHAVEVAARMGMARVIVPPRPGLLSALGLLQADERADFSVTRLVCLGDAPGDQGGAGSTAAAVIAQGFAELQARAQAWIDREGLAPAAVRLQPRVDMRYLGQSFEIEVPLASVPADQSLEGIDLLGQDGGLVEAFHARHAVLNGYAAREQAVEVVTLRLAALAPAKLLRTRAAAATGVAAAGPADGPADVPVVSTRRPVWFEDHGSLPTPVLERDALRPGQRLHGPAVLVQMDSTTLLPPDCEAEVDADANLVIHLRR